MEETTCRVVVIHVYDHEKKGQAVFTSKKNLSQEDATCLLPCNSSDLQLSGGLKRKENHIAKCLTDRSYARHFAEKTFLKYI